MAFGVERLLQRSHQPLLDIGLPFTALGTGIHQGNELGMTSVTPLHPAMAQLLVGVGSHTVIHELDAGPGQSHLAQVEGVAGAAHAAAHHGHTYLGATHAAVVGGNTQPRPLLGQALTGCQRENALTSCRGHADTSSVSESGKSM